MKDVFLSYASEDRETAARVAAALEARGMSVWWDRHIQVGEQWQNEIETNLKQAGCAVVLWSEHSIVSRYVRAEATFAMDANKLAAAVIDAVEIPVLFRTIQTADLRDWESGIERLASGVGALVRKPAAAAGVAKPRRRRWIAIGAAAPLLALAAIPRGPSRVDAEISASRVEFHTTGKTQVLLDSLEVRSLALRGFAELRIENAALWVADSSKFDMERNTYPESAWKSVPLQTAMIVRPLDPDGAQVALRPWPDEASIGVNRLHAASSLVTFVSPEKGRLQMELAGQGRRGAIPVPGQFRLSVQDCAIDGLSLQPPFTVRVKLERGSGGLEYQGTGKPMLFEIGLPANLAKPLFNDPIAVDTIEFQELTPARELRSTLDGPGEIRVSGVPHPLAASDTLMLQGLTRFFLRSISPGPTGSLRIRLYGDAAVVKSGPKGHAADRRRAWWAVWNVFR